VVIPDVQEPIIFLASEVFVDPFQEAEEQISKEREELKKKKADDSAPGQSCPSLADTPLFSSKLRYHLRTR
jgi:hypothetical protein